MVLNVRARIQIQDCLILLCYKINFLYFVKEKPLKEVGVAERTLALRNLFRRDLLREEMDKLKRSLEIPSLLHIRRLKITGGINKCQWGPCGHTLG